MDVLYTFIDEFCKEYNIDPSHDVTHSRDCVRFAEKLMDYSFSEDEKTMARYAAALHDCVDKKYVDPELASLHVHQFLTSIGWSDTRASALLAIVTTMSYSKLNALTVDRKPVFPDHGDWGRVYHIVRQADLLCSYRVHRCYQYQLRIHPDWTEAEHWVRVGAMFQDRMFKYVTNGWFVSREAMALIPPLIEQAKKDLEGRNAVAPAGYGV
jgi:exopolyphosphatase/pppGpp-phosphohydrolase|uniref:HD domain-containing protein n=1 Tax=viral metagenome TaxID=1070528 RepID=A0A6C0LQC7_9ZZZZ